MTFNRGRSGDRLFKNAGSSRDDHKVLVFRKRSRRNKLNDSAASAILAAPECTKPIVCFSHLRWDFVFQRPQHLLTRFAKWHPVYFIEEPIYTDAKIATLNISPREEGVFVVTPQLPHGTQEKAAGIVRALVEDEVEAVMSGEAIFWFYTPMALEFADGWASALTIYDCMDELSAFAGADPRLVKFEKKLFNRADIVFTGGQTLYEAKKKQHRSVHAMPSSIDRSHFAKALIKKEEPADQARISGTKIGFFGVLDERLDIELVRQAALLKPEWQFVFLGPVVKINPEHLPKAANIHYLGQKKYAELPSYLAHWDVAMLPFALNESTRFISPTKTPEYLAGGRPVVSTPIKDVVSPYGERGLVQIAKTAEEFVRCTEKALRQGEDAEWRKAVDEFLSGISWDKTTGSMRTLMIRHLAADDGAEQVETTPAARPLESW